MMKNSKKRFAVTTIFITFIVLAAFGLIAHTNAAEPTEPHEANALWLEPSSITIDNTTATIGDTFNVTAWVNILNISDNWQVTILFNTTYFNATSAELTAETTSDFFSGFFTFAPPAVIDNVAGSVLHGETIMGGETRLAGYGSLTRVYFELIKIPNQNHLTLNFTAPYGEDTFIENIDGLIDMDTVDGTDMPIIPESPQLIALLVATVTTASAILTKKFKR